MKLFKSGEEWKAEADQNRHIFNYFADIKELIYSLFALEAVGGEGEVFYSSLINKLWECICCLK